MVAKSAYDEAINEMLNKRKNNPHIIKITPNTLNNLITSSSIALRLFCRVWRTMWEPFMVGGLVDLMAPSVVRGEAEAYSSGVTP